MVALCQLAEWFVHDQCDIHMLNLWMMMMMINRLLPPLIVDTCDDFQNDE